MDFVFGMHELFPILLVPYVDNVFIVYAELFKCNNKITISMPNVNMTLFV